MKGLPQTSTPNLKQFNHSRLTHEIFRIGKHKERLGYDKIWVIKMGGPSQTGFPKFKNFNHLNQKAKVFIIGKYER